MAGTPITHIFEYSNRDWVYGLDWAPVTSVVLGGGYDWDEFHAWYSPSARRYFWGSGSGCSCNSFSDHPQERVQALDEANGFNPRELK